MTNENYVGELIRKTIKSKYLTNTYVIEKLKERGVKINPSSFSNKIYGIRDKFSDLEAKEIADILGVTF